MKQLTTFLRPGPLVAPTTFSLSGRASKLGDHWRMLTFPPKAPIMITERHTTAIAQGRREAALAFVIPNGNKQQE